MAWDGSSVSVSLIANAPVPLPAASVHFTLHIAPLPLFFLSEVNTTEMSPVEDTFGFFVLQYALGFPFAVTVSLSPFVHFFLSLLFVLNLLQTKDILAQESPILYLTVHSVFPGYFLPFCVLKVLVFLSSTVTSLFVDDPFP